MLEACQTCFDYIAKKYEKNHLSDMLFEFTRANTELLERDAFPADIMSNDKFIDMHSDDEKYTVLKDLTRYLLWKNDCTKNETPSVDIFSFDVEGYENGKSIEELESGVVIASFSVGEDGQHIYEFRK